MFAWVLGFLLFPALVVLFCQRIPLLGKIGAIVICYAAGLILGTLKVFPEGVRAVQEGLMTYTIPIALPLLFFSIDVRGWFRLAGRSLLSFLFMSVAVLVAATAGYLVFRGMLGPESWKAAGMLIGCYTGGTINLNAIGKALLVETDFLSTVNLADMLVTPLYLLLAVTFLQRLLLLVLPPFKSKSEASPIAALEHASATSDYTDYRGMLNQRRLLKLAGALGLAAIVAGIGGGLSFLVHKDLQQTAAVLAVSTLGLACSFIPAIRRIEKTFHLGNYFIMVFILAISSQTDLGKALELAPAAMGLVAVIVFLCVVIHVLLAAIFHIDADTTITTSIAGIFSPPFIPMVAMALKNREMLVTGVITGLIGWVIGNYLGIGYAYLLRAVF